MIPARASIKTMPPAGGRPASGGMRARGRLKAMAMAALASLSLVMALALAGCQTEATPEAETVLWIKLNDSLRRYESVLVQIVDRNDSNKVLETLWNKPMPSPGTDIQPFRLKNLADDDFIVKIMGYLPAGNLALYTQITYEGGKKTVLHKQVVSNVPRDWLTKLAPSEGLLSPVFHKDSSNYALSVDKDKIITFSPTAEIPSAIISLDGETVPAGTSTEPITVTAEMDTLRFNVTDTSTGTASTRTYTVIIKPILPPDLSLATLVPSVGELAPVFDPTQRNYSVKLPIGVDTVSFTVSPADTRTMNLFVAGKSVFTGQRTERFKIDPGSSMRIPFEVRRGSESSSYQVFVVSSSPLPE